MQPRTASDLPRFSSLPSLTWFHAALLSGVLSAVAFRLLFFTSQASRQPKRTTTLSLLGMGQRFESTWAM